MNVQSYEDIYNKLVACMVAGQNKITDFNQGSIASTLFESFSRIVERLYLDTKSGYTNNLKAAAYSIFDFQKKLGEKAVAQVVFSRAKALSYQSIIPVGTRVASGNYTFITTEPGKIDIDEINSNPISVQAENIGIEYNVPAKTINVIETNLPADIVIVSNALKASGGTDDETETEMLGRFKKYINGLQGTNNYGLLSSVLGVEGVRSASIDEHFPPENNIYNLTVYIDDGTGGLTPELKNKLETVINGDDTSVNPGKRASGINVRVLPATPVTIDVKVTCTIYRVERTTAEFEIQQAIEKEINSLGVNEDFILTSLILKLRSISYIKDVTLELPVNNVKIGKNQIARFGTAYITLVDKV